ncbi:hypothetical protein CEUSTIGMA_g6.t1 [Chlamydomonas eustigma]|uniref:Serine aminopeptidase S33 domain-containing protein n=1 Tax=Chlamydomonas eustigma TaxID=1157962 RepID=A0A250WPT2_9CHLO|nr:hypothetical protein CEUSTIGMA_g6.t1 [Chlamydomonas eustigma]|eukprot:GAX72550.1 hypothetical protein CEUSTIGMA_g6.t1 [Chlamydomonas eustigma]
MVRVSSPPIPDFTLVNTVKPYEFQISVSYNYSMSFTISIILIAVSVLLVTGPWPWTAEVRYGGHDWVKGQTQNTIHINTESYSRRNVYIAAADAEELEAWLYLPKPTAHLMHYEDAESSHIFSDCRCIIMAHGLGGQRDMGLHLYADRFASEGYHVLVFDYRSFGGSTGEPRHWVSPKRHVEDWAAVIQALQPTGQGLRSKPSHPAHMMEMPETTCDASNNQSSNSTSSSCSDSDFKTTATNDVSGFRCSSLALWGTSMSGGHVLVAAAAHQNHSISAVISQIPLLSGRAASRAALATRGVVGTLKTAVLAVHDVARSLLGLSPVYIRIVGKTDELALMQLPVEELDKYFSKHPAVKQGGWRPWALARLGLEMPWYNPVNHLQDIHAPVLFVAAEQDRLCSPALIKAAASDCGMMKCELAMIPLAQDHFSMYSGQAFEQATTSMLSFLKRHLNHPS